MSKPQEAVGGLVSHILAIKEPGLPLLISTVPFEHLFHVRLWGQNINQDRYVLSVINSVHL